MRQVLLSIINVCKLALCAWGEKRCILCLLDFPDGSVSKESTCNAGDLGSMPGEERSPGGGHGNTLPYDCLENPHGQRSLAGYNPRGHKELEMTE